MYGFSPRPAVLQLGWVHISRTCVDNGAALATSSVNGSRSLSTTAMMTPPVSGSLYFGCFVELTIVANFPWEESPTHKALLQLRCVITAPPACCQRDCLLSCLRLPPTQPSGHPATHPASHHAATTCACPLPTACTHACARARLPSCYACPATWNDFGALLEEAGLAIASDTGTGLGLGLGLGFTRRISKSIALHVLERGRSGGHNAGRTSLNLEVNNRLRHLRKAPELGANKHRGIALVPVAVVP